MNVEQAIAFKDELEKNAAAAGLLKRIAGGIRQVAQRPVMAKHILPIAASGAGRSAIGAGVGAGVGALADGREGAIKGGLIGAGAGYASPLLTSGGRKAFSGAVKRFAQRQRHGVTGGGKIPLGPNASAREIADVRKAQKAGLTSIPGLVGGLAKNPKKTLKSAWNQTDRVGKAMAALDVGLSASHIADPNTQEGYGEKALGTLGSSSGYLLSGRMPLIGSLMLAGGAGTAGKYLGRGVDKLVGHKPPQANPQAPGRLLGPGA